MSLGSIVLDEVIVPVVEIRLQDGGFMLVGELLTGDDEFVRVREGADISVFDPGGRLVVHVPSCPSGRGREACRGGVLRVELPIQVPDRTGSRTP